MGRYTIDSARSRLGLDDAELAAAQSDVRLAARSDSRAFLVYRWEETSDALQRACRPESGVGEWLVITRNEPWHLPTWIKALDAEGDPDVHLFEYGVVYVGKASNK